MITLYNPKWIIRMGLCPFSFLFLVPTQYTLYRNIRTYTAREIYIYNTTYILFIPYCTAFSRITAGYSHKNQQE